MSNKKLKDISSPNSEKKENKSEIPNKRNKRNRISTPSKIGMWFFAFLSLGVLGFAVFTLFSGAKLKIYPRVAKVSVDENFKAVYAENNEGDVYYETMKINESAKETIEAKGEEEVSSKASGKITIYNNYSKSPQKLVENTRFKASNGLIYKTKNAVSVPGQTLENGKLVPGEFTVTVYADEPGAKYNIKNSARFTIPGLKGTELYNDYHANLKTKIKGGEVGTRPVMEEAQKEKAIKNLKEDLRKKLVEQISAQIPENYVFYKGTEKISFDVSPIETTEDTKAKIVVNGSLSAPLFSQDEFAKMIAKRLIDDYEEGNVFLDKSQKLAFSLNKENEYNLNAKSAFEFSLKGDVDIIWQIDKTELSKKLVGRSKTSLNDILSGFVGIGKAQATITPFWRQKFPQNANNIDIVIKNR